jgi:hypothetical protein
VSASSILGWVNNLYAGVLTSTSAAPLLPVTNLQTDIGSPSTAWQTAAGVTSASFTCTLPAAASWRAFGLFRVNLTPSASVTFTVKLGVSSVWTQTVAGPAVGYGQCVIALPGSVSGDSLIVAITDATNPDGFLNIPLAFAGPAWTPATGPSWQSTMGRDSTVAETVSRGGQEYPILYWSRRRWEIALDGVRSSEIWPDIGEIDRLSRVGGNMLFIPDYSDVDANKYAVYGRLAPTSDVTFPYNGADRRAWRARITERL